MCCDDNEYATHNKRFVTLTVQLRCDCARSLHFVLSTSYSYAHKTYIRLLYGVHEYINDTSFLRWTDSPVAYFSTIRLCRLFVYIISFFFLIIIVLF